MIKHLSKISGVAAFAVIASSVSAEVAINENLSLDGYATAAAVVTEPAAGKEKVFFDSNRLYDSAKVALNGKYDAFTSKVSIYNLKSGNNGKTADAGLLDAYVTYKSGDIAVTGGQFNGWLGYESFDTPSNAFIDYGPAGYGYNANYGTGTKVEYITKSFSTGVSVRDSALGGDDYFGGDGDFSDDLGYEAYVLYTGVDKLTVFVGAGYEDAEGSTSATNYYSAWAAYALTDKLTLVGEYGSITDNVSLSYTLMATYAVTDALSVAGRYGFLDSALVGGSNYTEFGLASTYTFTKNFAVKTEVTKRDLDNGGANKFFYAVQGIFKF